MKVFIEHQQKSTEAFLLISNNILQISNPKVINQYETLVSKFNRSSALVARFR